MYLTDFRGVIIRHGDTIVCAMFVLGTLTMVEGKVTSIGGNYLTVEDITGESHSIMGMNLVTVLEDHRA